jgi:DNA-binding NtrC family response regulator
MADMSSEPGGTQARTARILVIEDDSMIRMLLADMLESLGHTVAGEAARIDEALAAAQNATCDVAILDVDLGGKSCEPVAQALAGRKIPFIFATGYGAQALPESFRDRPTLKKPFHLDGLGQTIETALRAGGVR